MLVRTIRPHLPFQISGDWTLSLARGSPEQGPDLECREERRRKNILSLDILVLHFSTRTCVAIQWAD